MPTLNPGASIDVVVPAGSSIAVRAYEDATVNVMIPLGQPGGPASVVSGTGRAFGPFSVATNVRLFAAEGVCQYEVNGSTAMAGAGASATIVDDLTTGGRTSALSAQQGVVLKGLVDAKADAAATSTALGEKVSKTSVTPGTAMTSRALTDADDGGRFTVTGTITITPHANPVNAEFYAYFSGAGILAFTEAGGVSVNDKRQVMTFTGEQTPVAALLYMGGNVYDLVGSKA